MAQKKVWKKPAVIILCRGNENGNVLLACKQVKKGCTVDTASKTPSL